MCSRWFGEVFPSFHTTPAKKKKKKLWQRLASLSEQAQTHWSAAFCTNSWRHGTEEKKWKTVNNSSQLEEYYRTSYFKKYSMFTSLIHIWFNEWFCQDNKHIQLYPKCQKHFISDRRGERKKTINWLCKFGHGSLFIFLLNRGWRSFGNSCTCRPQCTIR